MRLGLIGYATNTGLGYQTLEIHEHLKPSKTLLVDLSSFNHLPIYPERYKGLVRRSKIPNRTDIDWLLEGIDCLFICETPLNWELIGEAKKRGVTTILQYNFEFLDYLQNPTLPKVDILAAPSWWRKSEVNALDIPVIDWPVPVNTEIFKYREIKECRTFLHIVGRPAIFDRNGTYSFLEAVDKLRAQGADYKYRVYVQPSEEYYELVSKLYRYAEDDDFELVTDAENREDMYLQGDVLVLPRRYGGLCLPAQEALACGLPVIMPDVDPNRQHLQESWLYPATKTTSFKARTEIDVYTSDIDALVATMDSFSNNQFMSASNVLARDTGKMLSWENLTPLYQSLIEQVSAK